MFPRIFLSIFVLVATSMGLAWLWDSSEESQLRQLPPIFHAARYRRSGDVQIECLRKSAEAVPGLQTLLQTSTCQQRLKSRHESEDEIQVSANVLMDVTECLEISQSEFVPLVAALSGPRFDLTGVATHSSPGLLSSAQWGAFQAAWPEQQKQLLQSPRPSCRRIGLLFQEGGPLPLRSSCEEWKNPREVLLLFWASADRFARVTQQMRENWEAAEVDLTLTELDASLEDRLILRYWTHLLAYLTTPQDALSVTQHFVNRRKEQAQRIQPGELGGVVFLTSDREPARQTASFEDLEPWSSFLFRHVDIPSIERLTQISLWLRWVRQSGLGPACAAELWTSSRLQNHE